MTATLILVNLPPEAVNADLQWQDNSGELRNWPMGPATPDVPRRIPDGAWLHPDFDKVGRLIIHAAYQISSREISLTEGHSYRWDVGAGTVADVTPAATTPSVPPATTLSGGNDVSNGNGNGNGTEDTAPAFNLSDFVTQPNDTLVKYGVPDPLARPGVLTIILLVGYKFLFGRRGWIA